MMGLDDLIPQTRSITAGGKTVVVQVLRVRQYPGFIRAIDKVWGLVLGGNYLGAIAHYPDDMIAAVAAATDLEAAWLAELQGLEFLRLAEAVIEINLDFFARAVFPAARKLGKTLQKAMTSLALSPASSSADTDTATSSSSPLPN